MHEVGAGRFSICGGELGWTGWELESPTRVEVDTPSNIQHVKNSSDQYSGSVNDGIPEASWILLVVQKDFF